ncbi:unnamed protein product [Mytilus edulis]|uniref:Reverse transcriptase RNase H-like domain-containing protein n=1 Tax=Mytilus edulis TaxID=6550 RepID=A0A8S3QXU7_MYTED|nr:unnamed protein product [Mytilus edulis]
MSILASNDKSLECKNLLSTKKFPDDVTKLVDDELRKGYLNGPFTKPPFDTYRISPIGIVEGKYSKKKRLILDLSAPHNNVEHHSINDLINKEDYSLTYIPLSAHKTVGPSTSLEYLGIILDSMHMIAKLPDEKLVRIKDILYSYLNRRSCTKREMLSLLGHLNYACKVIIPGRSFVSYLLTLAHSVRELYHHVTITKGCRDDMAMWFKFLSQWNGISFFISDNVINASDFHLFTDASSTIGYGGYFRKRWFQGIWPDDFIRPDEESFSMAYLELYPIVISAILWGHEWSTKRILFHCDNMSSVYIINKGRSKCNVIMNLVRRLTWCAAKFNFCCTCCTCTRKENNTADALSRYQMKRFRQLAPDASPNPCTCPPHSEILWS